MEGKEEEEEEGKEIVQYGSFSHMIKPQGNQHAMSLRTKQRHRVILNWLEKTQVI
jgi:hypothetical protein